MPLSPISSTQQHRPFSHRQLRRRRVPNQAFPFPDPFPSAALLPSTASPDLPSPDPPCSPFTFVVEGRLLSKRLSITCPPDRLVTRSLHSSPPKPFLRAACIFFVHNCRFARISVFSKPNWHQSFFSKKGGGLVPYLGVRLFFPFLLFGLRV